MIDIKSYDRHVAQIEINHIKAIQKENTDIKAPKLSFHIFPFCLQHSSSKRTWTPIWGFILVSVRLNAVYRIAKGLSLSWPIFNTTFEIMTVSSNVLLLQWERECGARSALRRMTPILHWKDTCTSFTRSTTDHATHKELKTMPSTPLYIQVYKYIYLHAWTIFVLNSCLYCHIFSWF